VEDKNNGGTNAKPTGPVPQFGKKEQEPAHDIPDQRGEIDGRRNVL
jgi:hypothetical protein